MMKGVGGRRTMLEKLWLAVTITFALYLFCQVHVVEQTNGASYRQQVDSSTTILVTRPEK